MRELNDMKTSNIEYRTSNIQRPRITPVSLAEGLAWRGGGNFRFEEKMDGVFEFLTVHHRGTEARREALLAGERMCNGDFYAFDIVHHEGQDLRGLPLRERLVALDDIFPPNAPGLWPGWATQKKTKNLKLELIRRPSTGTGGEFLEAVLARGGEGVVCKDLEAPFGIGQWKAKRRATFDLMVVEKHISKSSVRVGWPEFKVQGSRFKVGETALPTSNFELQTLNLEDAGWCPVRGRNFERVKVGDIIEVAAFGRTASGKLREPRFVRPRPDKQGGALTQL
jgi:ATP-dependent DNA ligase